MTGESLRLPNSWGSMRDTDNTQMRWIALTDGRFVWEYTMPEWLAAICLRFFNTEAAMYGTKATMPEFKAYYKRNVPAEFKRSTAPLESLINPLPKMGVNIKDETVILWLN